MKYWQTAGVMRRYVHTGCYNTLVPSGERIEFVREYSSPDTASTGGLTMSLPDGVIYMDHAATTPLDPSVF